MSVSTISAQALHHKLRSGEEIELIDVRTPAEFREVHVEGARNIPLIGLRPPMPPRVATANRST